MRDGSHATTTMSVRALLWLFVAVALGASAPDPAAAAVRATTLIRPGIGIGKVRLGMTPAQVRRVLRGQIVVMSSRFP
jgi:hypothetical protein